MSDIHNYMVCESGIYHQDVYNDLDQGQGLLEVGQIIQVDIEIVPEDLLDDDDNITDIIENYLQGKIEKPNWIV